MTMLNKQGVLMDKWFKSPNAIIDDITGDIVSPQAAIILYSIMRLTEGVRGRDWASIPHSFFMRKTRTKRRETIGKYIDELVDNELVNVKKSNGKVTEYAINWRSKLWYSAPELEQKTASNVPVRFISTSTVYPYIPVRFIRTGSWETSTFHPYTYKDIKTKDNSKDIKKASDGKNAPKKKTETTGKKEKVLNIPFDTFWDLYDHKSTNKKTAQTKWKNLTNQQRQAVIDHLPAYIQSTPDKKYRKHPTTYLNQEHWNTPIEQPTATKIDRTTDKLAVNQNWAGANKSNIVEANTTLEEMMGSW